MKKIILYSTKALSSQVDDSQWRDLKSMKKGKCHAHGEQEILEGIVIPSSWDEMGNATGFSLFTFDEREYQIDSHAGKSIEISELIRKKIRVTFRKTVKNQNVGPITYQNICQIRKLDNP